MSSQAARAEGRVLIVDADYDTLGALARAVRSRGHHVVLAADGRVGLQRAVEGTPHVVLVDRDVAGLDVRTFLELLRDNPRTGNSHAFVMVRGDPASLAGLDARAEPILKPFNADEVAARVDEELRSRLGPSLEPELRGDLQQVALFDLLQVFSANKRTGRLSVHGPAAVGEIWIDAGRVLDAAYRGVLGEKALHRVLALKSGKFVFTPSLRAERRRIEASTEELLMNAAHSADEIERVLERLPPLGSLIQLAEHTPSDASPVAAELMAELDEPRALDELLDLLTAPDLDVLRAIEELLAARALQVFDPSGERVSLGDEEARLVLRASASKLRRPGVQGPVRIAVLSRSAAEITRFARALGWIEEFVSASTLPVAASEGALGSLGYLRFDGAETELYAMPLDPALRPLWGALLVPARVALVLSDEPIPEDVERSLASLEVRCLKAPIGWERPAGAADVIRVALSQPRPKTPAPRM
jgi:CheY-like chemotaxis protein